MRPHGCPVCHGTGRALEYAFVDAKRLAPDFAIPPCHACGGRGYVVVSDTEHVVTPVFQYEVHAT